MSIDSVKKFIKYSLQSILGNKRLVYRLPVNKPVIALTFDDGPDLKYTPLILGILVKNKVKATFFVTGHGVEAHPELAKRIVREGHAIGSHSYSHKSFTHIDFRQRKEEILKGHKVVCETLGIKTKAFRPPQGHWSFPQLFFCMDHSLNTILWNYNSMDYQCLGEAHLKECLDKAPIKNGDILLLHDDNMHTVTFLQYLIDKIKQDGFECVAL